MKKTGSFQPLSPRTTGIDLNRLIFLCDGVYAIALTLLALELRLPETVNAPLLAVLPSFGPKLLSYLLAFFVIGQQWDVHQRTMLHVKRGDGLLVLLTLVSLLFVTLLPASSAILGRYPVEPSALAIFGLNSLLLGLSSWASWRHAAYKGQLLEEGTDPRLIVMISRLWLMSPIALAVTLPLAFLNVYLVYFIWLLLPVISYTTVNRYMKSLSFPIKEEPSPSSEESK